MQSKLVARNGDERTFVLILDQDEEAFGAITRFAGQEGLDGASLTALGAFRQAKLAWFDPDAKEYCEIEVNEQSEVLSLIGDIAIDDAGKPSLHAHAVLGLKDGSTRGGHLMQAVVRPTLEVTVIETAAHLRRKKRPELGLALIDLS